MSHPPYMHVSCTQPALEWPRPREHTLVSVTCRSFGVAARVRAPNACALQADYSTFSIHNRGSTTARVRLSPRRTRRPKSSRASARRRRPSRPPALRRRARARPPTQATLAIPAHPSSQPPADLPRRSTQTAHSQGGWGVGVGCAGGHQDVMNTRARATHHVGWFHDPHRRRLALLLLLAGNLTGLRLPRDPEALVRPRSLRGLVQHGVHGLVQHDGHVGR